MEQVGGNVRGEAHPNSFGHQCEKEATSLTPLHRPRFSPYNVGKIENYENISIKTICVWGRGREGWKKERRGKAEQGANLKHVYVSNKPLSKVSPS